MSTLYDKSAGLVRAIYDRRIATPPVLDAARQFPEAERFVDQWRMIRDEACAIAEKMTEVPRFHELMPEQAAISAEDGRDWRMFVLKAYGVDFKQNQARCPGLAALVASVPDVLSAALSFLAPHKHIPRHRGPFRGVTRFQLSLSVPTAPDGQPLSVLAIADREYLIGEGECLLWDDTFPHEVWNRSDQMRIALLLDVRRRGMPFDLAVLSRLLIGAIGMALRLRKAVRGE